MYSSQSIYRLTKLKNLTVVGNYVHFFLKFIGIKNMGVKKVYDGSVGTKILKILNKFCPIENVSEKFLQFIPEVKSLRFDICKLFAISYVICFT